MEFSIPTNWDKEFIAGLEKNNLIGNIREVYGKLALDDVGGGRAASSLAFVTKRTAGQHIKKLKSNGLKFNYLLNALCIDNIEFTREGQNRLRRLMDWLLSMDIDSVTIANPYLAMWVRKNYPVFSVSASANANIDSISKAKFWEGLGVGKITFPGIRANRDFDFIRKLRKTIKCKIQLIANNGCMLNCPDYINHVLMNSHASQAWHKRKGYIFDYHIIMCRLRRLEDPLHFIRSDWIRPEDVSFYEELGVDSIKLVDRRFSTKNLLMITQAYLTRSYSGNLLDLFPTFLGKSFSNHKRWCLKLFYLLNVTTFMRPFQMLKYSHLLNKIQVSVENKELEGFLRGIPKDCDLFSCDACGYCGKIAQKTVKSESGYLLNTISEYKKAVAMLLKGRE